MIELHVLGTVRVSRDGVDVHDVPAQPKRLALFTYLALARPHGFRSRDELLLLFWPDSTERKARASLRTSLHFLRKALGRDAIASRGSGQVALSPDVWCDARAFDVAIDDGRLEEAMALYRGPLLEGVRVEGSPEWEAWYATERSRLARKAREAVWTLTTRAAAAEDVVEMERLALHAVDLAPDDEEIARRSMALLDRHGRRESALVVYEQLRRSLEELELEPDPGTHELAERIRSTPSELAESDHRPRPESSELSPIPAPEHLSSPPPPRVETRRPVRTRWVVGAAVLLAVGIALTWILGSRGRGPGADAIQPAAVPPPRLAVLPFPVHGTDDASGLRAGLVDLLSASLDGFPDWRTADPRAVHGVLEDAAGPIAPVEGARIAERLDARFFVLGSVVGDGTQLRIEASLYDRRNGPRRIATARAEGTLGELFPLVDRIAADLATERARSSGSLAEAAGIATESLDALRLYLSGTRAFRSGDYHRAVELLNRAVEIDSTFALAAYELRRAGDAVGAETEMLLRADRILERFDERLPERARRLLEAQTTYVTQGPKEAETAYREFLERYPQDVEAWYRLGDILFHTLPESGRPFTESRSAFERVLEYEPTHVEALLHLARIEAWMGHTTAVDTLTRRALDHTSGEARLELSALRAVILEDEDLLRETAEELRRATDNRVWITAVRTADYTARPDLARVLIRPLLDPARSVQIQALGRIATAHLALAEGRPREAAVELETAERVGEWSTATSRFWLSTFPFFSGRCRERDPLAAPTRSELLGSRPLPTPSIRSAWRGVMNPQITPLSETGITSLLDACHGRFTPALAGAARIEASSERFEEVARSIRLHVAWAGGMSVNEVVIPERVAANLPLPVGRSNWILAELLRRKGRFDEALGWYGSVVRDLEIGPLPYYAPVELRMAEILDRGGRPTEARERYRRFLRLWSDPEPELRPYVERARARIAELEG